MNGRELPCGRVCEPHMLKFYVSPAMTNGRLPSPELTDLFLDPDEVAIHEGFHGSIGTVVGDMSRLDGPYGDTLRLLNCCVDDWWPEIAATGGTRCNGTCPADLTCNQ